MINTLLLFWLRANDKVAKQLEEQKKLFSPMNWKHMHAAGGLVCAFGSNRNLIPMERCSHYVCECCKSAHTSEWINNK